MKRWDDMRIVDPVDLVAGKSEMPLFVLPQLGGWDRNDGLTDYGRSAELAAALGLAAV